ncbi:MAG: PKD domain-containing protein, partial [Muribaculaceae bacterium]|nr:PKD domain-containing protein [Muribaculaceae bacterium]
MVGSIITACNDDNVPQQLSAEFTANKTMVEAGETVFFMDKSSGNPVRWDWEFEGGSPATSQCFSPEVVFELPGTYKVKLTVGRGEANSVKEASGYITVAYPNEIVADFTADKVQALSDETISFTDNSVGFPSAWEWTFATNDGKVVKSTERNPALMFEPGLYTVTLHVTNPNAEATVTKKDYLNIIDRNSVAAEFSADNRMAVEGAMIQFTDETLGRPTMWKWTFEGATPATSTERNPIVKFHTAGKYKVTLEASNEINNSVCEKEGYIMIMPLANLVLFYPMDGDCKDLSPNGIDATMMNAGECRIDFNAPSRHEGLSSARFSGSSMDNYEILSIPDNSLLQFGSGATTRVFWINTSNKT